MRKTLPLALLVLPLGCNAVDGPSKVAASASSDRLRPAPTEHRLQEGAEEDQKQRREEWFEERHRTPPDVDWRAIERANGRAQIAKRNLLGREEQTTNFWAERGSQDQAGRMHVAALSTDGQRLYAGSSLGGLWRGTLAGEEWTPLGDNLFGGVHWLVVLPGNSAGDPDVLLVASDGGLVHVSRDEGMTWEVPTGIPAGTNRVRRLVRKSDGTNTVFLMGRVGSNHFLYRSTDNAHTFATVYTLGNGNPGDVWVPRNGGSDVYMLTPGELFKSTNNGTTWSSAGTLPVSNAGFLAGSEAGAPRFWAVVGTSNEILRSDDAGTSWTSVGTASDYWTGSICASIVDPDLFAYGGVEVWRTYDAGASFTKVNPWSTYYGDPENKLHADIPGLDVIPFGPNGETWYVSTDGGLYRSSNLLSTVKNLSLEGLRVSQYYSTHTSSANPDHVIAGSQDQGYQRARLPADEGETVLDFRQWISGDYGHLTSGNGAHDWVFCCYPGFILIQENETGIVLHTEDFPTGENHAWIPPLFADPNDIEDFFFCATRLYRYEKSPSTSDWTPSLWSTQNFQASGGEYVSAFVLSPVDSQRGYLATNRGRLFYSNDGGVTWTQSMSTGPDAHYFYGTALLASSTDVDTVWVGGSGYGPPSVYRSTDGGQTFEVYDQGLPDTLVYCLGEAPDGSGAIFAGTEMSAYKREDGSGAWVDITSNEAPATIYWSVEALPHENTMRFGTYGRGIWDFQLDPPAEAVVYGCGVNPPGSIDTLGLVPQMGSSMTLALDNPLGTQASGSLSFVFFSLNPDPGFPCGTLVNNFGMSGPGAAGELLINLLPPDPAELAVGSPWISNVVPAFVTFPVPSTPSLEGISVFAQGLLLDPSAAFGVKFGLTDAVELRLGS